MDLSKHLETAADAVKRRNYAFAIKVYGQLLAIRPDHGEARAGLREALYKKAEARPPSRILAWVFGGVHLLAGSVARLLGRHAAAARAFERYLALDPLAEGVNLRLADSLHRAGYGQSALAVYRAYAGVQPRCLEAARSAGRLLYEAGHQDEALGMYEQALGIDPRDQESLRARKNLAAEGALKKSGMDKARSSRDLIKDKGEQRKIEKSQRLQLSPEELATELEEHEGRLAENPDDPALLREVARLREMDGDLQGALDCLERMLDRGGDDRELADRAGDLRLRLQEKRVKEARDRDDPGAAGRAEAALREARVQEFRRRVQAWPTDLSLRFDLGEALLETGAHDEAIAELQQSVKDPRKRVRALFLLGQAFRAKDLPDLALGQLDKALEAAEGSGPVAKDILYAMGTLCEETGRSEDALRHFSRILEQDIGYRDVAAKVERIKAS